ncbi:MAG: hypothetical protein PVH50_08275, partial [Anaerolineae bacterium]
MTEDSLQTGTNTSRASRDTPRSRRREVLVGVGGFVARRLLFDAIVLLVIIFLSYLGLGMARGTEFYPAVAASAADTLDYVGRILRGDLGRSVAASVTQASVTIADVLPGMVTKSLGLLGASLALAGALAVPVGVWAATRRRSGWSLVTILVSIVGVSVPSFFAALLLQLGAIRLTRLLGHRVLPVGGFGWDRHIIMPALVLAARP